MAKHVRSGRRPNGKYGWVVPFLRNIKGGFKVAKKTKFKKTRSYTKTKTKKKSTVSMEDLHSGISSKMIYAKLHPTLKHKGAGKWKFMQTTATLFNENAGSQFASMLFQLCTQEQFTTNYATPNESQVARNLFDLNADRTLGGNTTIPSVLPSSDRMAVYYVRVNVMITNFESIAANFDLYLTGCKKSNGSDPGGMWTNSLIQEGLGVPMRTRALAGVYGGVTTGAGSVSDIYSRPTDLVQWRDHYKTLRYRRYKLAAGATEEINFLIKINRVVKHADLAVTNHNIAGLTVGCMIVGWGQPVHQNVGGLTVTTGSVRLGATVTRTYVCGQTAASGASRFDDLVSNNLISTNTVLANQITVDITDLATGVDQA